MSNFVVSARKYRPQKFKEVVGQDHVVGALESALKANKLPHAFLFCGPRGVGKTTCARILARTLNCTDLQNGTEPCGQCESCQSFEKNASFNIFELDAASYNSVEDIRLLNEQVRVPPQSGRYKTYIIDEVHMLSKSAFNAFLKTLEEPPSYAIFILATTEKHKILPTILSRCQVYDFRRIQVKDMVSHLETIAGQEGIDAERDGLVVISEKSDGALRDALSLFDRMASVSDNHITYKSVIGNLNLLDYDVFFKTVDACLREDVRDVLLLFDNVLKNGFEGDTFLDGLADHLRDLLVCKDPKTLALLDHSDHLKERYQNQAELASTSYIFSALNLINEADLNYPMVRNKRLQVEMALAKICFLNRLVSGDPFISEKKTADHTISTDQSEEETTQTVADAGPLQQKNQNDPPPAADLEADESLKTTARESKKKAPATDRIPAAKPVLPAGTPPSGKTPFRKKRSIPQVKPIAELQKDLKIAEAEARQNSLELNTENLSKWWDEYRSGITSAVINTALSGSEIDLDQSLVIITVPSKASKARLQEMNNLLSDLRQAFHSAAIQLSVEVNEDPEAEEARKPRKPLTNKEKYEKLVASNPNVDDLRKSLDLIIDHDE